MLVSRRLFAVTLAATCLVWLGCAKPESDQSDGSVDVSVEMDHDDEHEHEHEHDEEMPASYGEAVTRIGELRDKIRDAFAKDDHDTAHDPLHEVGHLLEHLPELAKGESFHVDVQANVKKHTDKLMDLFAKVDAQFHDEAGTAYSEVSADIDAAFERLRHPEETPTEETGAAETAPEDASNQ